MSEYAVEDHSDRQLQQDMDDVDLRKSPQSLQKIQIFTFLKYNNYKKFG